MTRLSQSDPEFQPKFSNGPENISMRKTSIEGFEKYQTAKEAIDAISELETLTYDLHGLTMAVASQFETHVELSPAADLKNPYARMISQSAINSMVYLVQRSAEIAEELNARLHEAIQRIPDDRLNRGDTTGQTA